MGSTRARFSGSAAEGPKLKHSLAALYEHLDSATKRRLRVAFLGLFLGAFLEVVGLALILPLMQIFSTDGPRDGILERISAFLGNPSDTVLAVEISAAVFLVFMAKGIFMLTFRWWVLGFTNRRAADATTDLFERYLYAPYTFHLRRNTADLLRTMNNAVGQAYISVINGVLSILTEAVTVIAVCLVLLVTRPLAAVFALAYFSVIGYALQRTVKRRAERAGVELQDSTARANKAALQGLGSVKESIVRWAQPSFVAPYREARMQNAMATRSSLMLGEAPRYALEMVFIGGVAAMSAIIFLGDSPNKGAATLALFVAAGFRLLPSLARIMAALSTVRVGLAGVDLLLADVTELAPAPAHQHEAEPLQLGSALEVEDLVFKYDPDSEPVLRGLSIKLPAGESLAVVGASGAGKSTLIDLILGLYSPTGGRILSDGVDVHSLLPRWQRSIGLVPQDVYILDDSLRSNIAFGDAPDVIDEARLAEAVSRAQLGELIETLPEGLETFVGERGVRLSGGQRQRIGIARALYLRPQLLVLDEATSALDNETERRITETIDSLRGQMTIIVVAHRLSTVRGCDRLLFLQEGRVEAFGTFDEVRASSRTFAHLVNLASLEPSPSDIDATLTGLEPENEKA